MIDEIDMMHLRHCVDLAHKSVSIGDEPFGAILVSGDGDVLMEDHNRVAGGDNTQHPEFSIARWAAKNLSLEERQKATVYTSGEHCPMCAAAHGWVELGRIVYAASSEQLVEWLTEIGAPAPRVKALAIEEVISDTLVEGPVLEFSEEIKKLHILCHKKKNAT